MHSNASLSSLIYRVSTKSTVTMVKQPAKPAKKSKQNVIDKDTVALLEKTLQEERDESDTESEFEIDPTDSTSVIKAFKAMDRKVKCLQEQLAGGGGGGGEGVREEVEGVRANVEKLQVRFNLSEDENYEIKQRSDH